jgi:TetR/AcrR family transcriptional repressor of nem operon
MGRPKTYDRDEVLENALLLFWRKGFEGAHLQELVEVTGLNRFSLYKEFGSKEGLFEAAMDRYMGQLASLVAHLEAEPAGVGNIRRYFEALIDYRFRHGCFLVNTLSEKHVVGQPVFGKVRAFVKDGGRLFEENLRASQARGEIEPATDVVALARFLVIHELGLLTHGILETRKSERRATLEFLDRVLV